MKLRLAVIGSLIFALVAAFVFVTRQSGPGISVHTSTALFSNSENTALRVFFNAENLGDADVLLSAHSDYAKRVSIVRPEAFSDAVIAIPANSTPVFSLDSIFLELSDVRRDLAVGDLIPMTLVFQKTGEIRFKAIVSEVDHSAMDHSMHSTAAMATDNAVPQITLSVGRSPVDDSWNIAVSTTNFTFVNAPAGTPHIHGEGHAHLYLNGLKLQRLYSEQASIGHLLPGSYKVSVTLNTHMHAAYMNEGRPVTAVADIESR